MLTGVGPALVRPSAAASHSAVEIGPQGVRQGVTADSNARQLVQVALDATERGGALVYRSRLFALGDAAAGAAS